MASPTYVHPSREDRVAWHEFQRFWSRNAPSFNAIRRLPKNKLVPFVGAGLSRLSDSVYPLWEDALRKLTNELNIDDKDEIMPLFESRDAFKLRGEFTPSCVEAIDEPPSLYFISKLIMEKMGEPTLYKHLCHMFAQELFESHKKSLADKMHAIALLPELSNYCLTVNLDTILEYVYGDGSLVISPTRKRVEFDRNGQGDQKMIIKLHGILSEGFEWLIWTKDQVDNHYGNESELKKTLQLHLPDKNVASARQPEAWDTLLYLGTSLFDDFFAKTLKHEIFHHFAIVPIDEKDSTRQKIKMKELEKLLLEELGIIPIFYPSYPEDKRNHKWVREILRWLAYKIPVHEIKSEDLKILSDEYYLLNMETGAGVFLDNQFKTPDLKRFLDNSRMFCWWEVCGDVGSSKTRHMQVLDNYASNEGWDVRCFATDDFDNFREFEEFFGVSKLEKNTLLIFDDADCQYAGGEEEGGHSAEEFFDKLIAMREHLASRNLKLRVIFTYTIASNAPSLSKDNWWRSSTSEGFILLSGNYYIKNTPLRLQWSEEQVEKLLKHYISKKTTPSNSSLDGHFFRWWRAKTFSVEFYVPQIGVLCVDVFIDIIERGKKPELPVQTLVEKAIERYRTLSKAYPRMMRWLETDNDRILSELEKMLGSIIKLGHAIKRGGLREFDTDGDFLPDIDNDGASGNTREIDERERGNW